MKLSRLYSNYDEVFTPIDFRPGVNVVLAEIRLPENRDKDTHNLGKTTLGILIDFCFLARKEPDMFLFKHKDLFGDFVFFLEIQLSEGGYVTIRREVKAPSKISFMRHLRAQQDFRDFGEKQWDHYKVPFVRAKTILDGLLNLSALKPWNYRKGLGYFLRSQNDYSDVFQLRKFASAHAEWKPFIAQLLGFNANLITDYYHTEAEITELSKKKHTIETELLSSIEEPSRVEGLLLLKQKQIEEQQALLDGFDFRSHDTEQTQDLVHEVDNEIAVLNSERYTLMHNRKRILSSLEEGELIFNPDDAARLFRDAGIFFEGQIKHDFEQLIAFNRAITEERRSYLVAEQSEIDARLAEVNAALNKFGKKRSEILSFLNDTDVVRKYKTVSQELGKLRSDVLNLISQREHQQSLQRLNDQIRLAEQESNRLEVLLEADFNEKNDSQSENIYSTIRILFDAIIKEVIAENALLTVSLNKQHHPEFEAEILDDAGRKTSAQKGTTYKKLLCIAFDMALIRAHTEKGFPSFVYHDGVFESLDKRKKSNLLKVIRDYSNLGIQQIITLIDTDMPPQEGPNPVFSEDEIVVRLHDEGAEGRLFKIKNW